MPGNPGLEKLVNRNSRVYGHSGNFRDWFYFSGNTDALTRFLRDLAALKHQEQLVLVVHPGRAPEVSWRAGQRLSYNWQMDWAHVVRVLDPLDWAGGRQLHLNASVTRQRVVCYGTADTVSGEYMEP